MLLLTNKNKSKVFAEYENAISEYKTKIAELEKELYFDKLTNCKNKKSFKNDIAIYEQKSKYCIIALSVDLDDVNKKNRENGDAILSNIAKRLCNHFANVYHIGGTKFNILMSSSDFSQEGFDKVYNEILSAYPDIKIFVGIGFSTDGIGLGYFDICQIAIKRMYADKRIKKPENKDIERELEEQERLKTLIEENKALTEEHKQVAEDEKLSRLKALNERRKNEEELEMKKKMWESNAFNLPDEEYGAKETFNSKILSTMWFNVDEIGVTVDGVYRLYDIYVFPTEYKPNPQSVNIVVVIDNKEKYKAFSGTVVKTGIARQKISINARFDDDGNFITNIVFEDEKAEFERKTIKNNKAIFMPKSFGKVFFDYQLFPIKQNTNGTCDSVALSNDNTVDIWYGSTNMNNKDYNFILSNEKYFTEEIN